MSYQRLLALSVILLVLAFVLRLLWEPLFWILAAVSALSLLRARRLMAQQGVTRVPRPEEGPEPDRSQAQSLRSLRR